MSIKRLFAVFNSFLIATAVGVSGFAQGVPQGDGFGQTGLRMGPSARPFGEPSPVFQDDFYNYDGQMWSPMDITSVDGRKELPSGIFFEHDWTQLSHTRPEAQFAGNNRVSAGTDFAWGNRHQLGYIGEQSQKGFHVSWLRSEKSFFTDGQSIQVSNPKIVTTNFHVVEINRVFRQPLSQGGFLEPYVGARFMSLGDDTIQDTGLNRFSQKVRNSAVGAQVGGRYVRGLGGRTNLIVKGNVSGMFNNQRYFATDLVDIGGAILAATNEFTLSGTDFVPAFDVDIAFQFNLTRDISLRAGGVFMWSWQGLARANTLPAGQNPYSINSLLAFPTALHTEDFIATGLTFGVDWRR